MEMTPVCGSGPAAIPYLPTTLWMRGAPKSDSIKTRDLTRTLIESNSPVGMVLTVPVKGGASAVKKMHPESLEISDHGDWTRIHLGAIEAAYGREPYFLHLFPEIAAIITGHPQFLMQMNRLLEKALMDFLNFDETFAEIRQLRESHPDRCSSIATRLESKINPSHSLIEPLFRLGPDTIFLL